MAKNFSETMKDGGWKRTAKTGISFGTILATVISYTTWQSVGWAVLHGALGWIYVIYFVLRY